MSSRLLTRNGAQLTEITPDAGTGSPDFTISTAKRFANHRVDSTVPRVEKIERRGDNVWVHFNRDLEPVAYSAVLRGQFDPSYGAPLSEYGPDVTDARNRDLLIEKLKHQLAGLRRQRFGATSEALDQLEFGLEDEEIARAAEAPPEPTPATRRSNRSAAPCRSIYRVKRRF